MRFLTFILLFTICGVGLAQYDIDRQLIEKCLPKLPENSPGYIVSIVEKGEVVFQKSAGKIEMSSKATIDTQTTFDVASLAKQFTATGILLLAEQGKLKLDDKITDYLPLFPKIRTTITINHLLGHSSGIRSYLALLELQGKLRSKYITKKQFWKDLRNQKNLSFYPGDAYAYNNTGYVLLAEIIENVALMDFQVFMEKYIFQPLEMNNTSFGSPGKGTLAQSYKWTDGKAKKVHNKKETVGDGSLFTTMEDFLKWDKNFQQNILGKRKQDFFETMERSYTLNNGRKSHYGKGVFVKRFADFRLIEHSGNWDHYYSQHSRFPDLNLSVIVFSNSNLVDARAITENICSVIITDKRTVQNSKPFDPKLLKEKAFEGYYVDLHTKSSVRKVFEIDGNIFYVIPTPFGKVDYQLKWPGLNPDKSISFISDGGGRINFAMNADSTASMFYWENSPGIYSRLKPEAGLNSADSLLVGKYYNDELDMKIRIRETSEDNQLRVKIGFFKSKKLERLDKNFFWVPKNNLIFEFTEENLFFHADRASNIRFERIK